MHLVRRWGVAVLAALVWLLVGCQSSSRTASSSAVSTPQDKARQEQLSNMSRQDAGEAKVSQDKPAPGQPVDVGRRAGQRVVDQPVGPRR